MIDQSCVFGGTTYFDHFKFIRALQHAMSNMRRLQYTVACLHYKFGTLIFIDNTNPAFVAIDQLENYVMMVNIVSNRTTLGNTDVRSYVSATPTIGNQIPVLHSRASDDPVGLIPCFLHTEGGSQVWYKRRGICCFEFHPCAIRCHKLCCQPRCNIGAPAEQTQ